MGRKKCKCKNATAIFIRKYRARWQTFMWLNIESTIFFTQNSICLAKQTSFRTEENSSNYEIIRIPEIFSTNSFLLARIVELLLFSLWCALFLDSSCVGAVYENEKLVPFNVWTLNKRRRWIVKRTLFISNILHSKIIFPAIFTVAHWSKSVMIWISHRYFIVVIGTAYLPSSQLISFKWESKRGKKRTS